MGLFSNIFNKNNDVEKYQKECMVEFEELKRKTKSDVEEDEVFKILKEKLITFLSRCTSDGKTPKYTPRQTVYLTCALSIETIIRQQINKLSEDECKNFLLIFSHIVDVYPQWGDTSFLENRMTDMLEIIASKYPKCNSDRNGEIEVYKRKIEELENELSIKEGMIKRTLKDVTYLKNIVLEQKKNSKEIDMLRELIHSYRFDVRTNQHAYSEAAKKSLDKLYDTLYLLKAIQDNLDEQIVVSQERYEEIATARENSIREEEKRMRNNGAVEMLISWDRSDVYAAYGEVQILKAHHDFLAYLFDCIDKIKPIVIEDRYHNRKLGVSDDD